MAHRLDDQDPVRVAADRLGTDESTQAGWPRCAPMVAAPESSTAATSIEVDVEDLADTLNDSSRNNPQPGLDQDGRRYVDFEVTPLLGGEGRLDARLPWTHWSARLEIKCRAVSSAFSSRRVGTVEDHHGTTFQLASELASFTPGVDSFGRMAA